MTDVIDLVWNQLQDELAQLRQATRTALVRSERAETAGGVPSAAFADLPYSPIGVGNGDEMFVTDACKTGEGVGTGTGCICYYDAATDTWLRVYDDQPPLSAGGGGDGGGVASVTATAPLQSSGGANPDISLIGGLLPLVNLTDGATAGVPLLAGGAGDPAYGQLALDQATAIKNTLPVGNGGTGTNALAGHGAVVMNAAGTAQAVVAPGAVGRVLTSDGTDWTSAAPALPSTVNDITITAGENLAARDICYVKASDGLAYKLDANASGPVLVGAIRGMAAAAINTGNTGALRRIGVLGGFTGLTAWGSVYASTTAGGYTQTRPSVTDGGAQVCETEIGFAISTTEVFILPQHALFLKRASLADGASLTIEHYSDPAGRARSVRAYCTSVPDVTLAEYDSTHYDTDIQLRGQSGAGGTTTITATGPATPVGYTFELAQSFLVTAGRLSQFVVSLGANTGSPTGTLTWALRANNAGAPGSLLATGTFSPTPSANNTINVTGGPFLFAATTYWLHLKATTAQSAGNEWSWVGVGASSYADGNAAYSSNAGVSWTASAGDLQCNITTGAVVAYDKLGQTLQVTGSGQCNKIKLYLEKVGSPTGTMTCRLETVSAGVPTGTLIDANATTTVAESTLGTSFGLVDFTFTAFNVATGTDYAIVLSTDRAASNTDYVVWGVDGSSPTYTDGQFATYASATWTADAAKDAVFAISGTGTAYDEPVVIGRASGGARDVACRFDDGAGADANTRTTFTNEIGTTADLTVVVELA